MSKPASAPDNHFQHRPGLVATGLCLLALLGGMLAPGGEGLELGLFVLSFAAGLWFPLREAWESVREGRLDVDFLMVLVAVGAWGLGHPEEGAALLVLFGASRAMEEFAHGRTRSAIAALSADMPSTVEILSQDGEARLVPLGDIAPGDRLRLAAGARFAVDARVLEGAGTVDLAAITGESEPLLVAPGDEVKSGAINGNGVLIAEALRPASESAYQKIISLVEQAEDRRSPAQVLGDRVGRWFTWGILSAACAGFLAWWLVAGLPAGEAAYNAMALLVAGSPCALVLSIPSAVLAAIARGARNGILFHGGLGLLAAAEADGVAFDKTGTLTTGRPRVEETAGDVAGDEALQAVARALAGASTHPASRAVLASLGEGPSAALDELGETPGRGMSGSWRGQEVFLGRDEEAAEGDGRSRVALRVGGRVAGRFFLGESLRPGGARAVEQLKALGLRVTILSGDLPAAASAMGARVGIEDARGGLSPEDKHAFISRHPKSIMVGDGVNDAPALAIAGVAVAMGTGASAAALAQSDIVLVRERPEDLAEAVRLGRRARRIVRQNIGIAVGAATILVAFALAGSLPLWLGVFGHEGGTVLVVLNSLRLLGGDRPAAAARDGARPAAVSLATGVSA